MSDEGRALAQARVQARREALREEIHACLGARTRLALELGCGHGHWLTAYAECHQEQFCLGLDLITKRVAKANAKRDKRGLYNLVFLKAEAHEFLELLPHGVELEAIFFLFPDPWPKKRHHRRRMIQPELLDLLAARCPVDTPLYFRTDHGPYFTWTVEHIDTHPHWQRDPEAPWAFERETYFQQLLPDYQSLVARRTAS